MTDQQLVGEFAKNRSDGVFGELVRRHIDLVYSAALRLVHDAHLTEDITQGVFLALAQNAGKLTDRPVLSGWLHRTTQNLAANAIRAEVRRRVHEQEAAAMNELLATEPDASWDDIAPHLDAALGELEDDDRDALMLRYFEKKSAPEMAVQLGISDEAAQKRVRRAVERLRSLFAKRGVSVGASGLVVLLTAHAVQAAPIELAAGVSAAALAGAAASTSTVITAVKIITMTTLQKIIVTAAVAVLAGAGLYEARQAAQLRQQVQALQHQAAPALAALQRERDEATNRLAALTDELAALKKSPTEVLKLRGEVGALRQEKAAAADKSMLNKLTADPEMRKTLRAQQRAGMAAIYSELAKNLKLSPEQTGQFNDLLADNIMSSIDLITQALHDHNSRAEIDQLFANQDAQLRNSVQALVGADGLAQYLDYTKNLLNTLTVAQFAGDLSGDSAAVAEKKSQLLQAMQNTTAAALAGANLPADYQPVPILNLGNIASVEEADQSLQLLDGIYAQVANQAASFLTADELAKFQTFRTNAINSSQSLLLMNRKLMAPISQ
jgi:RNA polymerase sigma factor (sigma-70 family)